MNDRERMVVSAHSDGEVEAPWKAEVERRLETDAAWADEADRHRRVKVLLASSPEPDFTAAQARVRAALAAKARPALRLLPLRWVTVAAALVVLAGAGGYFWGRSSVATGPAEVAELQVSVPKQLELKLSGEGQILMASTLEGPVR